jgi:hypothetical protein
MDRKTLRKMIIKECQCMAGDAELPGAIAAAFPMLRVLGLGIDDDRLDHSDEDMIEIEMPFSERGFGDEEDSELPTHSRRRHRHHDMDDMDDDMEMSHHEIHLGDEDEEVPEWADKMDEARGRKPWYMKKRRNMKKTEENAWYDIPKSPKSGSKKKLAR